MRDVLDRRRGHDAEKGKVDLSQYLPILDGYLATGDAIGVDLVREPDKLAHPPIALRAAVAWWEDRIPDRLLGDDDIRAERRLVNGGEVGLAECQRITRAARLALA